MQRWKFFACLFYYSCLLGVLPDSGDAARILGFFPSHSKSHVIIHSAVAKILAEAGHDVTVISTIPNVYKDAKYKFIHLELPGFDESFTEQIINKPKPTYQQFPALLEQIIKCTKSSLVHPTMQKFLQDNQAGSFDLLILGFFMNDFQVGLGAHFQCPIVISFMIQPVKATDMLIGTPSEEAYVPVLLSNLKQPLNFWGRVVNYVMNALEVFMFGFLYNWKQQQLYGYHFPSDRYPPMDEVKKNISLILTNHHFASQGPVRPNVPALIEMGGIQIKDKPYPLPNDIQQILDDAKEGAIYFSLGTLVKGSAINKERAKIMFDVLSKLPYKILWKWGDSGFPGESKNIIYKSWLPQDDILAHPNVKLFINHCGQGSVVESLHHGVPMVGMPLFGDQHANAADLKSKGFGVIVDYATLSEETFRNAILEVMENPKYTKTVKEFSALYRDRPMKPRDAVRYWIDYVLRYKGAKHLQSPAVYLNIWQRNSWDVLAFIWAVLAVIVLVFAKICKIFCCRSRNSKAKKEGVTKLKKN